MDDIRKGRSGLRDYQKTHDNCIVLSRVMFPRADEAIKGCLELERHSCLKAEFRAEKQDRREGADKDK